MCYFWTKRTVLTRLRSPFPPAFIDETIQTLHLLFRPLEDKHARRNIRQMEKYGVADLELAMAGWANFDLNSYRYWHSRLLQLQKAYDGHSPSSLSEYWFDRRNEVQWATFWMGLLVVVLTIVTVIFGIIQCATSIIQVYAIYHGPVV